MGARAGRLASSEETPFSPVHGEKDAGADADALGKIDAAPGVDGPEAAGEAPAAGAEVEDGGISG